MGNFLRKTSLISGCGAFILGMFYVVEGVKGLVEGTLKMYKTDPHYVRKPFFFCRIDMVRQTISIIAIWNNIFVLYGTVYNGMGIRSLFVLPDRKVSTK